MDNIKPIGDHAITPVIVAQELLAISPNLKSIYCVLVRKTGELSVHVCGDNNEMAFAAMVLQDVVIKNGMGMKPLPSPQASS